MKQKSIYKQKYLSIGKTSDKDLQAARTLLKILRLHKQASLRALVNVCDGHPHNLHCIRVIRGVLVLRSEGYVTTFESFMGEDTFKIYTESVTKVKLSHETMWKQTKLFN